MKHAQIAVVSVLALVLTVVLSFFVAVSGDEVAYAAGPTCTAVTLGGPIVRIDCVDSDGNKIPAGQLDLDALGLIPTVKVTIPGPTVKVPGPTKTVRPEPVRVTETATRTVRPAPTRVTETVRVPTERETVFVEGEPRTVFVEGPTETVTASPQPQPTATETVRRAPPPSQTRQPPSDDDTMEPDSGFFSRDFDWGDDEVTAGEAGIGLASLLGLMGLLLFAMYGGYYLGYKDKERSDTNFMRALSETIALRRNR